MLTLILILLAIGAVGYYYAPNTHPGVGIGGLLIIGLILLFVFGYIHL